MHIVKQKFVELFIWKIAQVSEFMEENYCFFSCILF
jgi:hypothetical protein